MDPLGICTQPDLRCPQPVYRLLYTGELPDAGEFTGNNEVTAGTVTASGAAAILSGTPVSSPLGYSQNEFGGTFGGPNIRYQTFFYFAYEGWRFAQPQNTRRDRSDTAEELEVTSAVR